MQAASDVHEFRISIFDTRTRGDNSEPERVVVTGEWGRSRSQERHDGIVFAWGRTMHPLRALPSLHERRKKLSVCIRRQYGVMQIVELTGLSWPAETGHLMLDAPPRLPKFFEHGLEVNRIQGFLRG